MTRPTTRRTFLSSSAAAGSAFLVPMHPGVVRGYAANDKLDVVVVGAGGKGRRDAKGVAQENLVGLCDVDDQRAAGTRKAHPGAAYFHDYRVMLEKLKCDAVVISTPDHTHAPIASMAMQLGKHIYCQKPLTHTVHEARFLTQLARRQKVVTSMGNQGTGFHAFREAVEVVRSGQIGEVREVHVWTNRPVWPQGMGRNPKIEAIPATMRWDLWLGPAPHRPYNKDYAPFKWRGFWDFGTGALGDMACHVMNMPYMALELGTPSEVRAESTEVNQETAPKGSKVTYKFPARGKLPACTLVWYDGSYKPRADLIPGLEKLRAGGFALMGSKGLLYSPSDYGERWDVLDGEGKQVAIRQVEPSLPRARGKNEGERIYNEWIDACKGQGSCLAGFDYAGPFTETVLLGNLAIRSGETIKWDPVAGRVTNSDAAQAFVDKEYSYGFRL